MTTPSSPSALPYKFAIVSYRFHQSPVTLAPNGDQSACSEGHPWAYCHHHPDPTLKEFPFLFTSSADLYLYRTLRSGPFGLCSSRRPSSLPSPAALQPYSSAWCPASRYPAITTPWTGTFLSTLLGNYFPFWVHYTVTPSGLLPPQPFFVDSCDTGYTCHGLHFTAPGRQGLYFWYTWSHGVQAAPRRA